MNKLKISIVSAGRSLTDRSWIKQDIEILKELGFNVAFIRTEAGFLRSLKAILSSHLLFGWFAYPNASFYAKILGRMSILNAVGSEVAYYPEFNYGLAMKAYLRPFIALGLRSADKLIGESRESAKWAEFWSRKKVEIIYEGIDTDKFRPLRIRKDPNNHVLLAVANLEKDIVPRKNLFALISAMKLALEKIQDIRLIIVGEKLDGYPPLRHQVEELGLGNKVVFGGKVSDQELLHLYGTCSIFVMPSLQEGFPTVCCEALSCQTPVITSNRPSMNEIFTNNINAILIDPADQMSIANAIILLLRDTNLAERLGKNGRELVVKRFSRDARKKKLSKIINEIVEKRRRIGGINIAFLVFYFVSRVLLLLGHAVTGLIGR